MSSASVIRGLLFHNMTLKISSLVLATVLWLHATTLHTYEEELAVDLQVSGIADSLVVVSPLPDKAHVSFRGKGDQLWWLFLRKPYIELSAEGVGPGTKELPIYPDHVSLPAVLDVQVTNIGSPRSVKLNMDRRVRKTVPVIVSTVGLPSKEVVRVDDRIAVDPAHVTLEGPAQNVDSLDIVPSEPLDLTGAKGPVARTLRLQLPDNPLIKASTDAVTARVQFERQIDRVYDVTVNPSSPLPVDWVLAPPQVRVHLWALSSLEDSLSALDVSSLLVGVIVPRTPTDSLRLDVTMHKPAWARQCSIDPPQVLLRQAGSP